MKLLVPLLIFLFACAGQNETPREIAKNLKDAREYEKAIEQYQKHIQNRLNVKKRPDWENPYIYLLDIGDIYLEQSLPDKALETYEEAEKKKVKAAYVNDHYRAVASWYESKGELNKALDILKKYADRDPELFNMMMDRLAKQLVAAEK